MMSGDKNSIHSITFILLIIGGLNWLALALFKWDVGSLFPGGMGGPIAKIIYILVGVSAIYEIAVHKKICKSCQAMMMKKSGSMGGSMGGSVDGKM